VGGGKFATAVIPIPPKPEQAAAAEPLSDALLQLAQVELLLAVGMPEPAAKLLDSYQGAPSPEIETARGLAALARKDNAVAKERFIAAMKLGDTTAVPAYEYAMLLRDEHAPDAEVRRYLTEAVGRNPNLAVAHFTLGVMAQRENRHRDAVVLIDEAIRVLPRQSYFWHALAMSHLQLNQPELARRAAFRAAGSATTDAQLEMAQGALKLISAKPVAAPAAKKPSVVVPDSWKPREGSARVDGTLEQIDCVGSSARFHVRPAGGAPVQLWVDKPGEVLLKDLSSMTFTFSCGPQQPRSVSIEFDAQSSRITAIRFR
jgi:predicted Zn-dependent protease